MFNIFCHTASVFINKSHLIDLKHLGPRHFYAATVVCRYNVHFINLNFYSYLERRGCCHIGTFPFYKILRKCTTSKFSVPQTRIWNQVSLNDVVKWFVMIMQVSVLWRCTSLISPLFFSVAFIQRTNVRGGYGNSWGKFFFFFLSFNFCDVSRATWKRHLNPYTAKVRDGVFLVCGQNPVVLPSKWNLCSGTFTWYYYFSVFHKLKQRIFFWRLWTKICGQNQIMQCDHSNETCFAVFSPGTFYFSALYKVKLLCASLAV